ncbi:hypothetical protein [Acinetobacter sp. ANC 3832]|uniref:hypothetical protein n=1 Tax=Acinetobacter sp. ANC 3832 TaxID=1977874 RepID=UPI001BB467D5|nr:hypothetical protein [Acinetobacter sp. ANC 3832]
MGSSDLIGVLGTLIGAFVALHIFNQWKKQKGSEVISIESREIFNLIEKIPSKLNIVLEDMMAMSIENKVPNDFDKERFINFRELNMDIVKRLQLIKFKNKHKDTLEMIQNFHDSYISFGSYYHQSHSINLDELFSSKGKYEKNFNNLKNDMYEYSLYKRTL